METEHVIWQYDDLSSRTLTVKPRQIVWLISLGYSDTWSLETKRMWAKRTIFRQKCIYRICIGGEGMYNLVHIEFSKIFNPPPYRENNEPQTFKKKIACIFAVIFVMQRSYILLYVQEVVTRPKLLNRTILSNRFYVT